MCSFCYCGFFTYRDGNYVALSYGFAQNSNICCKFFQTKLLNNYWDNDSVAYRRRQRGAIRPGRHSEGATIREKRNKRKMKRGKKKKKEKKGEKYMGEACNVMQ